MNNRENSEKTGRISRELSVQLPEKQPEGQPAEKTLFQNHIIQADMEIHK